MKKMFVLSMFVASAMICSCQKQDSIAEAQLAQRKTELDVREEALVQREKAVEEREKALAEREKAVADNRINQSRHQAPNAAQAEAERQKRIEQLPPELRALIPDRSQIRPERSGTNPAAQPRTVQRQLGPEDLQREWQRKMDKARMSGEAVFPAPQSSSPTPSPAVEATSPSPSPTPQ